MLSPEEIATIRLLNEQRTKGEWEWDSYSTIFVLLSNHGHILNISSPSDKPLGAIAWTNAGQSGDEPMTPELKANAAFIAACSVAVPGMLDTIDHLVETLRRLDSERKAQGEEPCSYCYGDSWAGPHKEGCELAAMLKLKREEHG